ncbi:hypothetical protein Hanom_Chr11g00989181 [Helianthus anomalus]
MESVRGYRMKEGGRWWATLFSTNQNISFFFFNKKTSPLRGECRHQTEGVRGVDVTRADWPCVREGTLLRGECPVHPNYIYTQPRT